MAQVALLQPRHHLRELRQLRLLEQLPDSGRGYVRVLKVVYVRTEFKYRSLISLLTRRL